MFRILILSVLLFAVPLSTAQETDPVPQAVKIPAEDGLEITGDYYTPPEGDAYPAVLLLHMLNHTRSTWDPLIPHLTEAGFAVLAVDMRGHGETGGTQDWPQAENDLQTLLDWLRGQTGVEGVAIVGASIGSNLALRGMAGDEDVLTAVALSPGLDYRGVTTEEAIETIGQRPVMLVASRQDSYSADSAMTLFNASSGAIQVRLYPDSAHGTDLFPANEALLKLITAWLSEFS